MGCCRRRLEFFWKPVYVIINPILWRNIISTNVGGRFCFYYVIVNPILSRDYCIVEFAHAYYRTKNDPYRSHQQAWHTARIIILHGRVRSL